MKIVISKEVFVRMIEVGLLNLETLELHFSVSEFESQYDSRTLVAIQPRVNWKELLSD